MSRRLAAALILLAAALSAAETPARRAQALITRLERLAASQVNAHPLDARRAEAAMRGLAAEAKLLGADAVAPLGRCLQDRAEPLKVRLYAAAFLGLNGDPAAFAPLSETAADPADDPGLRSACVQSLGDLRLRPKDLRATFESLARAKDSPEPVRNEALVQLARIGAGSVGPLVEAAKAGGRDPGGRALADAVHAARAIARAPDSAAVAALFELLGFARQGTEFKLEALKGLLSRDDLGGLSGARLQAVVTAMQVERGVAAVLAAQLLGRAAKGRADRELAWAVKNGEPGLSSEAASILQDEAEAREAALPKAPPAFSYDGWPGEGVPRLVWNGKTGRLALHREPEGSSEAAKLGLPKGAPIDYDRSTVVTRKPGAALARGDVELKAVHPGGHEFALKLSTGQPVDILSYRAEGRCYLRRSGAVFEAKCPQDYPELFELVGPPVTEWWLHLSSGGASGWLEAEQPGIDHLQRNFNGASQQLP